MSAKSKNKTKPEGFVISEADLQVFAEWIKKESSARTILKNHVKVLEATRKIEKMALLSKELVSTPFIFTL